MTEHKIKKEMRVTVSRTTFNLLKLTMIGLLLTFISSAQADEEKDRVCKIYRKQLDTSLMRLKLEFEVQKTYPDLGNKNLTKGLVLSAREAYSILRDRDCSN